MGATTVFYILAGFAIGSALLCIMQRNPVASALWLVSTMFALSAIFVLLHAQFIAVIQVLVDASSWLQANLRPSDVILAGVGIPRQLAWYADLGVEGMDNLIDVGSQPERNPASNPRALELQRDVGRAPAGSQASGSCDVGRQVAIA